MELCSYEHLAGLFEAGLTNAVSELKPERAFIAYRARKAELKDFPTPYASHGFALAGLYVDEDISTEVLRKTFQEGKSQLIIDAISTPGLTDRTSVVLSGLRSVLTVPLRHSNGLSLGLMYLDNRIKAGAFQPQHQALLTDLADRMVSEVSAVEARMRAKPSEVLSHEALADVRQKALSLSAKGNYTVGLSTIEQWICGRPEGEDLGLAYAVKGRILQTMGQMQGALEAVSVSVYLLGNLAGGQNEHYPVALNNLAGLHVALGNLERANGLFIASASYWSRLTRSESRHLGGLAATQYNLGKLHQELKQATAARDWFEKALENSEQAFGADHPKTLKIRDCLESC